MTLDSSNYIVIYLVLSYCEKHERCYLKPSMDSSNKIDYP